MIRAAKESDLPHLQRFSLCSPFGLKIWGEVSAYSLWQDFLSVWVQVCGQGVTAVLSRMGGTITLEADEKADFHELDVFCRMMCRYLFVRGELDSVFGQTPLEKGIVMSHPGGGKGFSEENFSLSEVYHVLSACGKDFPCLPLFEDWYVDMSHRIRHGAARAFLSSEGSSCALLTVCIPEGSILSGVATLPSCRGRRQASRLIGRICEEGENIFLFCHPERQTFYKRLGFQETGNWSVLT